MLADVFDRARQNHSELNHRWLKISHAVGGALPKSLLTVSLQRVGSLDLLLRCMESEHISSAEARNAFNYQCTMSTLWIGDVYEIFRLLEAKDRQLIKSIKLSEIHYDLKLLRIPLEKHEISGDKKLKDTLQMVALSEDGDHSDMTLYDKNSNKRAYIMPMGVSHRGSVSWRPFCVQRGEEIWLERLEISDRILEMWKI